MTNYSLTELIRIISDLIMIEILIKAIKLQTLEMTVWKIFPAWKVNLL